MRQRWRGKRTWEKYPYSDVGGSTDYWWVVIDWIVLFIKCLAFNTWHPLFPIGKYTEGQLVRYVPWFNRLGASKQIIYSGKGRDWVKLDKGVSQEQNIIDGIHILLHLFQDYTGLPKSIFYFEHLSNS